VTLRRVSVVGCSGAGKTTVAAKLAERLEVPHIELDAMYHQAGWEPTPRDELRASLLPLIEGDRWIVDGNYGSLVQDLVWDRADTIVWVDPPRPAVMAAVTRRTLGRMVRRTELWNGNRERFRYLLTPRPEENIILWTWTRFAHYRDRYAASMEDPANGRLLWIHLRSRREIKAWLASVGS
jgi:adenylate kinase family enzyme